ncbi:uncharacterized protein PV06_03331 [Exophiala oligosperma]|uniref:VOC domain-containing protein n=2 Tax=Chaetothyriales TaxID=34395 RepID=A0A0D2EA72_9EURO|nr:uncharacterized protein PV06_03331 [Exophiala oligosperma]KAJ9642099.1 hypothetical protein H2204_002468 [Knufia peltigerae]KIW44894.1 hypothetical protein PV06_03331 [Exophiala oligosperma]
MSPIDHITIPCAASKVDAEVAFFIKAFAHMGVKEVMRPFPDYVGLGDTSPWLWISGLNEKFEPIADDVHIQSMHVAVTAKDRAQVNAFHEAALQAGGKDHGAPGIRKEYHPDYYGAFAISPAGHNIEAVTQVPE